MHAMKELVGQIDQRCSESRMLAITAHQNEDCARHANFIQSATAYEDPTSLRSNNLCLQVKVTLDVQ